MNPHSNNYLLFQNGTHTYTHNQTKKLSFFSPEPFRYQIMSFRRPSMQARDFRVPVRCRLTTHRTHNSQSSYKQKYHNIRHYKRRRCEPQKMRDGERESRCESDEWPRCERRECSTFALSPCRVVFFFSEGLRSQGRCETHTYIIMVDGD